MPTPKAVLGFPLGTGQERVVTNDEARTYLGAVDRASDRVVTGVTATSVLGQPLPYAVVSNERHVRPSALRKIADDVRDLRDPRRTSARTAARTAKDSPAIVWVTANVHGGEKSGTDAALKTLYELAAGLSCEVARRNDNLVTIIVPTQNPDGRDAPRRQNEFGFDLNRDWFARTQQETDGKRIREFDHLGPGSGLRERRGPDGDLRGDRSYGLLGLLLQLHHLPQHRRLTESARQHRGCRPRRPASASGRPVGR